MVFRITGKVLMRSIQGAFLAGLILAAAYVSIGRILFANIDHYQTQIEQRLAAVLKQQVSIDRLSGSFNYLDPILEISGLKIGAKSTPAIQTGTVQVRLNSFQSIKHRTAIFDAIHVEGVKLTVAQGENGTWQILGLPAGNKKFDINAVWDFLANIRQLTLSEADVTLDAGTSRYSLQSDKSQVFELLKNGLSSELSMVLQLVNLDGAATPAEFKLAGKYSGDPRSEDFTADLYLNLPKLDLAGFLPRSKTTDQISSFVIDGEYWLNAKKGEVLVRGGTKLHEFTLTNAGELSLASDDITIQLGLAHVYGGSTSLTINQFNGQLYGESFDLSGIALVSENEPKSGIAGALLGDAEREVMISIPDLSVGKLSGLVASFGRESGLLSPKLVQRIVAMETVGELKDSYIRLVFGETLGYTLQTSIRDFSMKSPGDSLAISQFDALVKIQPEGAVINAFIDKPFSVEFEPLFPAPWFFTTAAFKTHIQKTNDGIVVYSDLIESANNELKAHGKFSVNINNDPLKRSWGLELGVLNAELSDSFRYLPSNLTADLRDWLKRSIKGGISFESGMVFHGPLGKELSKHEKVFEIYFKVADTILEYDPRWPEIRDVDATIYIGNREVYSDDATGTVFDSRILPSEIILPITKKGADTILINGELLGDFTDGLRVLNETPISELTQNIFSSWQGNGKMSGNIHLNIPIGLRKLEKPWAEVNVGLFNADIRMPEYNVDLSKFSGKIRYETLEGLSSKHFTSQLFGQAISGRIITEGESSSGAINVLMDGRVDIKDLYQWSGQTLLTQLDGLMPYQASLYIPQGERAGEPIYIEAESNMLGVTISLPEPMQKTAEEKVAFHYRQSFLRQGGHKIELNLNDDVQGSLKVEAGLLTGGRVHFGPEAIGVVAYDKLRVSGKFATLDYLEWENLTQKMEQVSDVSLENELVSKLDTMEISADLLSVAGLSLDAANLVIGRGEEAWHIDISNELLVGRVTAADDRALPLEIDLLSVTLASEDAESSDPMGDVNPGEIVAFNFRLNKLVIDDEDYGEWAFKFRPDERRSSAMLSELNALVKGVKIQPNAQLRWRQAPSGAVTSEFSGDLTIENVAEALEQWGYASSVEGDDFKLKADLVWAGSPAMVDLKRVDGAVKVSGETGKFVQAETNVGALKVIGIFDFASLMRRFRLDFSDVIEQGFVFDEVQGAVRLNHGVIDVIEPIKIEGSGSIFKVGGRMDFNTETLDNDMVVTLPLTRNLPWYAAYSAYAIGPMTGVAVFLAQRLFKNQFDALSSAKYKVSGSFDEPNIEFVSIFNATVRDAPSLLDETEAAADALPKD